MKGQRPGTPGCDLIRNWSDVRCGCWAVGVGCSEARGQEGLGARLCGCDWLRPWRAIGSLQGAAACPVKDGGCTPTPPPRPGDCQVWYVLVPTQQHPSQPDLHTRTLSGFCRFFPKACPLSGRCSTGT